MAGIGTLSAMTEPVVDAGPDPWRQGRGTAVNPTNRFERLAASWDEDFDPAQDPAPQTCFFDDATRSAFSRNDSVDVPFAVGLNPYRGCEHGCSYCYARQYHEFLGLSAGLDFETRILVKRDLPRLVREELSSPRWTPQVIGMSGATDCYQPVERRLRLTRACLEVLAACRNPVRLITKNALVTRDIDVLAELARHRCVSVALSVTTLDQDLSLALEPRASVPAARLAALRRLTDAGIPTAVSVAPIIPGLTDHEIPRILAAAAAAGARFVGWQTVHLPGAVEGLFAAWLRHHRPNHADKVMRRIRELHGGACSGGGDAYWTGRGIFAQYIATQIAAFARRHGLSTEWEALDTTAFIGPLGRQETIF